MTMEDGKMSKEHRVFPHWMANEKRFHARRVRGSRVEYEIVED